MLVERRVGHQAEADLLAALQALADVHVVDQVAAVEVLVEAEALEDHLLGRVVVRLERAHVVAVRLLAQLLDPLRARRHVPLAHVLALEVDRHLERGGERAQRRRRVGVGRQPPGDDRGLVLRDGRRPQRAHHAAEVDDLLRLGRPRERVAEQRVRRLVCRGELVPDAADVGVRVRRAAEAQQRRAPVLEVRAHVRRRVERRVHRVEHLARSGHLQHPPAVGGLVGAVHRPAVAAAAAVHRRRPAHDDADGVADGVVLREGLEARGAIR